MVLSCALFSNWLPLLVLGTYAIAPLPNAICSRCAQPDDFLIDNSGNALVDFGRFMTGCLVVTGIALPIVLAHSNIIVPAAMYMSIAGGLVIYATMMVFSTIFQEQDDF